MENCRKLLHHFHLPSRRFITSSTRTHCTNVSHSNNETNKRNASFRVSQPIKHTSQTKKQNTKTKLHQKGIDRSWTDVRHFRRIYSIRMSNGEQFTRSLFHNLLRSTAAGGGGGTPRKKWQQSFVWLKKNLSKAKIIFKKGLEINPSIVSFRSCFQTHSKVTDRKCTLLFLDWWFNGTLKSDFVSIIAVYFS